MKLLIVEDETLAVSFLRRGLSEEGFAVDVAADAVGAEDHLLLYDYDVILLDINLPGENGFSLCRRWRERGITSPILFLTAREDVSSRVEGLNSGGDDYLVKPFAFEELLARVRVLLRRKYFGKSMGLRIGDVEVDTVKRQVCCRGRVVPLTAREYQLLEYFAYNADKLVTRTQLWEHVWESNEEPDSNVVDVYVGYLRNKLGRDCNVIKTMRGLGYILQSHTPAAAAAV